jgi:hypothetical protein
MEVFIQNPGSFAVWSRDFFHDLVRRISLAKAAESATCDFSV